MIRRRRVGELTACGTRFEEPGSSLQLSRGLRLLLVLRSQAVLRAGDVRLTLRLRLFELGAGARDLAGAAGKAFIVLRDGYSPSEPLENQIRQFVKAELAAYEYPRRIVFARELPRTVTGKVRRSELRAVGR